MSTVKCLIIGSGPSGYTAGIYASRANLNPVLYTGEEIGGQLMKTKDVENFPGYPKGVLGSELMDDLREQAIRYGTKIVYDTIEKVDFSINPFKVTTSNGEDVFAESVIISTGASAKWLGIPSEEAFMYNGVSACATCDGFFHKGKEVAIIGGGDTSCEEALYLANICTKVHMLVRKGNLRASKIMQERVLNKENITLYFNTETVEILGDDAGVNAIRVKHSVEFDIPVSGVFVAIGHKPNSDIFKDYLNLDEDGYIITEPNSTKTNIEGVFACGDVQDKIFRQAVTASGTGCMSALEAERYLSYK
jgi:thioredoxin reductase (NADPH)